MDFVSVHSPKFPMRVYSNQFTLSADDLLNNISSLNLELHGAIGHLDDGMFFGNYVLIDDKKNTFKYNLVNTFCGESGDVLVSNQGIFVPCNIPVSLINSIRSFTSFKRASLLITQECEPA